MGSIGKKGEAGANSLLTELEIQAGSLGVFFVL